MEKYLQVTPVGNSLAAHPTVLRVAKAMGQFTSGQGELLRRALGGKGSTKAVEQFQTAFIAGAQQQGVSYETAAHVFQQLKAFGGYSFPKSHAAAFAVIVYQSAYLKRYFTADYICAILNEQPMGFWSPAVVVNDARRHGITVLPVSIFQSHADCTVEEQNIRLGLRYVAYLSEQQIAALIAAREERVFADLPDFLRRVTLPRTTVENLILVGAMDEWNVARRQLLWELGERYTHEGELSLNFFTHTVDLPPCPDKKCCTQNMPCLAYRLAIMSWACIKTQWRRRAFSAVNSSRQRNLVQLCAWRGK